MKIQLTKSKTIDVRMPWEGTASTAVVAKKAAGLQDVTGVVLFGDDPRGCPAVRLQRRKGVVHLAAAGFVKPPPGDLPTNWEESKMEVSWELPALFQAPQAALSLAPSTMLLRQTTMDALRTEVVEPDQKPPARKRLGVNRGAEKPAAAKKDEIQQPYVPTSRDGVRSVIAPLADGSFVLQAAMAEFQVQWLSRLLPEGRRPTASSVQIEPAALLSALYSQPEFVAADGTAVAVFVTARAFYIVGWREGEPVLFRECSGMGGYAVMRELVKSGLGVGDDLVETVLNDNLIDPRPALEPLVRPVLQQLQLSVDYLAQRHDVHVDHVFLMGLPAGAVYWSGFAQEAMGIPFISPNVFEGLPRSGRAGSVPDDMTDAASQVFAVALGAARAAMEVA